MCKRRENKAQASSPANVVRQQTEICKAKNALYARKLTSILFTAISNLNSCTICA